MAKTKVSYDEKSIKTLDALQHIRLRTGMYIGRLGDGSHPLQRSWIAEQVPQCGYCQSGQIMRAADLLANNPQPNREEIIAHMSTNICRCGTYSRIIKAIERAAEEA